MSNSHAVPDSPLTAAEALSVLTDQQRVVARQLGRHVWLISGAWGIAWLVGFASLWLMNGGDPALRLAAPVAWTIFAVVFFAAIAISAILGIRSGRGIRSNAARTLTGIVYGVAWIMGILAMTVLGVALLANGMSRSLAYLFYPSAYALLVGVMYLAAAAIWRVVPAIVTGCLLLVLAAVAPFFGDPTNYLVFSVVGGVLFLALALGSLARTRSERGAAARG